MIALHAPCLALAHRPQFMRAMQRVGEALGWQQYIPQGQTCCGLPAWEAGYDEAARDAARRTVRLFAQAETVVTPSAICLTMFRDHIPALLREDPLGADAQRLARNTRSWCALVAEQSDALLPRLRYSGRIMWLDVCGAPSCANCRTWVESIPGLTIVPSPGRCCSFSHHLSRRHPEIAAGIAENLARLLLPSRADVILVHEPGCLWRLGPLFQGKNAPRLLHPAEFLAALLSSSSPRT